MPWDPAETRKANGLFMTDDERTRIYSNFAPLDPKLLKADGVFEGGGVLGIAFLGALRCFDELGLKWCDLGGTSAGAITASLLSADYTQDELEKHIGEIDYNEFLTEKTIPITGFTLTTLAELHLYGKLGEYSTQPFHQWIEARLKEKNIECFADTANKNHDLKVIASDLTRAEMIICPDSFKYAPYKDSAPIGPENFEVAKAVVMSMSIPFFFEPTKLKDSIVVDGGVTSNFPLWIFDEPDPTKEPAYPTFGFRLMDTAATPTIDSPVSLIKGLIRAMRFAGDRRYLQQKELGRVINIDLTDIDVTATSFSLSDEHKAELYTAGYKCAKRFLLNNWNWSEHLATRGFRQPDISRAGSA